MDLLFCAFLIFLMFSVLIIALLGVVPYLVIMGVALGFYVAYKKYNR